jgi:hypothetical protein
MGVFDKGDYVARVKQDNLKLTPKTKDYNEGFEAGYKSASDRYIALGHKEKYD